jgi:hypothetical protein
VRVRVGRDRQLALADEAGDLRPRARLPVEQADPPVSDERETSPETQADIDELSFSRGGALGKGVVVAGFPSSGKAMVFDAEFREGELELVPVARFRSRPRRRRLRDVAGMLRFANRTIRNSSARCFHRTRWPDDEAAPRARHRKEAPMHEQGTP